MPEGYDDLTRYTFQPPDGSRRLSVEPAAKLESADALLESARAYRDQVVSILGGVVDQDVTQGTRPDGLAVVTLGFSFPAGDRDSMRLHEWAGFVRFPDNTGVQISYVTPITDDQAEATFRQILLSARPAGRAAAGVGSVAFDVASPAAGAATTTERRQVATVELDVPRGLQPPSLYHFASTDGGVRLSLEVGEAAAPALGAGVAFGPPAAPRSPGGLFTRVGVTKGDLGAGQRYEVMEEPEAPPSGPVAFSPTATAPAFSTIQREGSAGPVTEVIGRREARVGDVRVLISVQSGAPNGPNRHSMRLPLDSGPDPERQSPQALALVARPQGGGRALVIVEHGPIVTPTDNDELDGRS